MKHNGRDTRRLMPDKIPLHEEETAYFKKPKKKTKELSPKHLFDKARNALKLLVQEAEEVGMPWEKPGRSYHGSFRNWRIEMAADKVLVSAHKLDDLIGILERKIK